jgi:sugar (pentulose or hexulose) kinase
VEDFVLGVDMGTGAARAVALASDGRLLAEAAVPYGRAVTDSPELPDPSGWSDAVTDVIGRVRKTTGRPDAPKAVSVGGQSPTTVALTAPLAVTFRHPVGADGDPITQHARHRELLRQIAGAPVRTLQIWDWMLCRLGAPVLQTRWPGDERIPDYGPCVTTGAVVGASAGCDALPTGVPLVSGAADFYLAAWAAGVDVPGRAIDPGGRSGGIGIAVRHQPMRLTTYGLRGHDPSVDIVGGPVSSHGLMLEWLAAITGQSEESLVARAGASPAGARGVFVLPYLEGERMPRWNRRLRAEIVGLSSGSTVDDLARGVLEGAAYGLAHIVAGLRAAGVGLDVLVCAGSPAKSTLWCAIKADVLEVPVEIPHCTNVAAFGSALSAGAACGWWPAPGEGRSGDWPRPAFDRISPHPDQTYRRGLRTFVELGDAAERRLSPHARGRDRADVMSPG